jgi:hypothetical protein
MSARGKGELLEERVRTAALAWGAHGVSPRRPDPGRRWRRLAGGFALPWWPQPWPPTPWGEAILSQETGSFTARSLQLRVSDQSVFR